MVMPRAAGAVAVALLLALPVLANDLLVDARTLQMNDLVTITVSLEGSFAAIDAVSVPLQNLVITGEPWVSSEFAWINGEVVRRKVFRYRARPLAPGPARVGPLVLVSPDGQRETLPAKQIQVMPDRTSGSNDPEVVLRELRATGRAPVFVIAETSKTEAFVGEPLNVTWWLYNAASIQHWQIVGVPKLAEFWTEERPRTETPERLYIGDMMVQRLPIRRATLFPLHSGALRIGGLSIEASVMRLMRDGPFSVFEGELLEATFTSAPVELNVKPLPPGPPVDAIGDLVLSCDPPVQRNGGPVVVNVVLRGLGNVRAATAPRFSAPVEGRVQVEGGEVAVVREEDSFEMTRRWRYVIFPAEEKLMEIPALSMVVFSPSTAQRKELRCATSFVNARLAQLPVAARRPPAPPLAERVVLWPWLAAALALVVAALLAWPRLRRELRVRREAREIVGGAAPAEIRERIEGRVSLDAREATDRGDAWRSLRSLLDAAERDRDIAVDAEAEIERRVRELLRVIRGTEGKTAR